MKQTKEPNKTNLNKAKFRNKNAITLIALVVTIVVLLILAGVTISLLLDENGIIAKSKYARLENRASQVEDEIGMWKQNNFINKESDQAQEEADTILESLISRNLLKEDEIDREQEIITIKKKDGSILKQISYSQVTINISRNPETEKSGAVILTVDSVEGMTIPNMSIWNEFGVIDYTKLIECIELLNENQKKEIIKSGYIKLINEEDSTANCKNFEDVLKLLSDKTGQEITEEIFWESIERSKRGLDGETIGILSEIYYNEATGRIEGYTVTNPDGEISNTYAVTENGTYTFKVQDIITGKTYTKKVEVTNIDKSLPTNVVTTRKEYGWTYIYLENILSKEYTTFEKAYIILNGEKIEIDEYDIANYSNPEHTEISSTIGNTLSKLVEEGKLAERPNLYGTTQTFIIVKDGIEYTADVLITVGSPR